MKDPITDFFDDPAGFDADGSETVHPPMVVDREDIPGNHSESVIDNSKEDYEFVRKNLKQIIETNVKALERLSKIAGESESPRAFEVLSGFMKQMTEANESLMKLHKDTKELTEEKGAEQGEHQGDTHNHFHGSTEDFLDFLEQSESKVIDQNE